MNLNNIIFGTFFQNLKLSSHFMFKIFVFKSRGIFFLIYKFQHKLLQRKCFAAPKLKVTAGMQI